MIQQVECIKCGVTHTIELNGAKPYNKTTKRYKCYECINGEHYPYPQATNEGDAL